MKTVPYRSLIVLLVLLLAVGACTRKNNLTGNNFSDIRPISFTDSLFTLGFSFGDTVRVSGFETVLLAGNYGGASAMTVMRFSGMPAVANLGVVTDASLSLTLKRRSDLPRNPLILSFKRLNWAWRADSTFVIADSSLVNVGIADYVVPVIPTSTDSTITISLPNELIKNWAHEGSNGLSIAVTCSDPGWVEFYSIDSGTKGPQLSFKYRLTTDSATAEIREFKAYAISDSYRVIAPPSPVEADRWIFRNISPSRLFLSFGLNPARFTDMDGTPLDPVKLKRVTVNKAELVLYVKNNPYYKTDTLYSLRAFNARRDSINAPMYLSNADYELLNLTSISSGYIRSDSVVVSITPIVQGYVSGKKENLGIIIRSLHEILNFGELELWHFNDAPQGKKPFIRVRYTPPFL